MKPFVCEKRKGWFDESLRGKKDTSISYNIDVTAFDFFVLLFLIHELVLNQHWTVLLDRRTGGRAVMHCVKDAFGWFRGQTQALGVYLFIFLLFPQLLLLFLFPMAYVVVSIDASALLRLPPLRPILI